MSNQLSVGPILQAIDAIMEQLDDAGREGVGMTSARQEGMAELRAIRERVVAMCRNPDDGDSLVLEMLAR